MDDLRERRIAAGLGDAEGKASGRVDRSADHIGANALGHRTRLAGQHRFVDKRRALDHLPIDRHFFAGLDQDNVADQDLVERDFNHCPLAQDVRAFGLEA